MSVEIGYSGSGAKTIGRAVVGAAIGGLLGVLIGWKLRKPLEGAVIGSLTGATAGGVSGYFEEREYLQNHAPQGQLNVIITKRKRYNPLLVW